MGQMTWKDFSSAANPPFPKDGDEHEFSHDGSITPVPDKDGQFSVQHKMGYVALWESQMTPMADQFMEGKKKVLVKWKKEGRYTSAVVVTAK
jgi:hypothetical protein